MSFSFGGSTPSDTAINQPNLCGQTQFSRDVWFRFFTGNETSFRIRFDRDYNRYLYLYSDSCADPQNLACFGLSTGVRSTPVFYLPSNTYVLIRVLYDFQLINGIKVETLSGSRKIHSTLTGGDWNAASTWVENRIPGAGDSVFVSDGSTVTLGSTFPNQDTLAYLQIGRGGAGTARLRANSSTPFQTLYIRHHCVLQPGDSLIFENSRPSFTLLGDLVQDGGIRNRSQGSLLFVGTRAQRWSGSGTTQGPFRSVAIHKTADSVRLERPFQTQQLDLVQGVAKALAPLTLVSSTGSILGTTPGTLRRMAGAITATPQILPPQDRRLGAYRLEYRDETGGIVPSTDVQAGPEWQNIPGLPTDLVMSKFPGRSVRVNGNRHVRYAPVLNGSVLAFSPGDTLKAHFQTFYLSGPSNYPAASATTDTLGYVENAVLQLDSSLYNQPGVTPYPFHTSLQVMGKAGKKRALMVQYNGIPPKSLRLTTEMIDLVPSGPVQSPLTGVRGFSMVRCKANQVVEANKLRLAFYLFRADGWVGLPSDLRIAQGPSPNGPWKAVSLPQSYNADSTQTWPRVRWTGWNLDLSQGEYFCLATTGSSVDLATLGVLPPRASETGCLNSPAFGVVVRNAGSTPLSNFGVFARSAATGETTQVLAVANPPLNNGQKDTVWFLPGAGLSVPGPGPSTRKVWVSVNNDTLVGNDTLPFTWSFPIRPVPYREDFQSVTPGPNQLPADWWGTILPINFGQDIGWSVFRFGGQGEVRLFMAGHVPDTRELTTGKIGPLPAQAIASLRYRFSTVNQDTILFQPGDSLVLEASRDCGQSFVTLDRLSTVSADSLVKRGRLQGLLPFSEGEEVVLRIRYRKPTPFNLAVSLFLDSVEVNPLVSVEKEKIDQVTQSGDVFHLLPNPARGQTTLACQPQWIGARYSVWDARGKEVRWGKVQAETTPLVLQGLTPGIYQIGVAGSRMTRRLLVE